MALSPIQLLAAGNAPFAVNLVPTDEALFSVGGALHRVSRAALQAYIGSPEHVHAITQITGLQALLDTLGTAVAARQPLDADLTAIASLASAADRLPYATGAGTWALAPFTAFGRSLVDDANAAAARTTLGAAAVTHASPFCGVAGTANAIALTSGAGIAALAEGQQVRFRANAANTGPVTISVDGSSPRPTVTMRGTALPAGYIRTDAETAATFDGASFVVDRQRQLTQNANGEAWLEANGTFTALRRVDAASRSSVDSVGGLFRSALLSYPYPIEPSVILGGAVNSATPFNAGFIVQGSAVVDGWAVRHARVNDFTGVATPPVHLTAHGLWY